MAADHARVGLGRGLLHHLRSGLLISLRRGLIGLRSHLISLRSGLVPLRHGLVRLRGRLILLNTSRLTSLRHLSVSARRSLRRHIIYIGLGVLRVRGLRSVGSTGSLSTGWNR